MRGELTCVESGVLLHVRQLLESSITIRTFVRLLTGVNPAEETVSPE